MTGHLSVGLLLIAGVSLAGCTSRRALDEDFSNLSVVVSEAVPQRPMDPSLIAQGKGVEITHQQLDREIFIITTFLIEEGAIFRPGVTLWIRQDVLEALIQIELVSARATLDDKAWGREKGRQRMDYLRKAFVTEEQFKRRLKPLKLSVDELRDMLIHEAVAESALRRELAFRQAGGNESDPVGLTEDEIEEQMKPYIAELWLEAEVRISDPQLHSVLTPHRPD